VNRCVAAVFGASVLALAVAGHAQEPDRSAPPGYVTIDGRKNPDDIPEYVAWGSAFKELALLETNGDARLLDEKVSLTAAEKVLVFKAGRQHVEREAASQQTQLEIAARLSRHGVPLEKQLEAVKPVVMAHRERILDAEEALLAKLGAEARMALTEWVNGRRAHITMLVPKADLEEYRKPR
jgi:hypothetical protein